MTVLLLRRKERKLKKYYIYSAGQLWEVDYEIYKEINTLNNQIYYRAKLRGECIANRRQRALCCDGDCHLCRCYTPKTMSIDQLDGFVRELEAADARSKIECALILADMERDWPEGGQAGRLIMEGYGPKEVSEKMGMATSTYRDRIRRLGRKLKED